MIKPYPWAMSQEPAIRIRTQGTVVLIQSGPFFGLVDESDSTSLSFRIDPGQEIPHEVPIKYHTFVKELLP